MSMFESVDTRKDMSWSGSCLGINSESRALGSPNPAIRTADWAHFRSRFVSSLCIPESNPDLLLSGGGDPNILVHNWQTGHLLRQIPILPELSPCRTVRTVMRRGGKRVRQALMAEEEKLIAEGKADEVERMRKEVEDALEGGKGVKMKGLTDEEWRTPTRGWVLPEGDGICVARMEMVGQNIVFFSEG